MKRKLIQRLYLKFQLGIAAREEEQKLFESKETEKMLRQKWEDNSDLKEKGEFFNKEGLYHLIEWKINNKPKAKKLSLYKFVRRHAAIFIVGFTMLASLSYFGLVQPLINTRIATIEVKSPRGQHTELRLPDGTKVTLNSESTLKYPKKFSNNIRLVELQGEAYFEVVENIHKPFIVNAEDLEIEVLGTSFNVMAYQNDKTVETTLVTGKVRVSRLNKANNKVQKVILSPNHKVTYLKDTEHMVIDKVNVKLSTSWKDGILLFDNEPFESLINKLERWYDTEIVLSDDIKDKHRYTMTIENESIDEVLEMLKKTTPVDYTRANGKVIFYATKK